MKTLSARLRHDPADIDEVYSNAGFVSGQRWEIAISFAKVPSVWEVAEQDLDRDADGPGQHVLNVTPHTVILFPPDQIPGLIRALQEGYENHLELKLKEMQDANIAPQGSEGTAAAGPEQHQGADAPGVE